LPETARRGCSVRPDNCPSLRARHLTRPAAPLPENRLFYHLLFMCPQRRQGQQGPYRLLPPSKGNTVGLHFFLVGRAPLEGGTSPTAAVLFRPPRAGRVLRSKSSANRRSVQPSKIRFRVSAAASAPAGFALRPLTLRASMSSFGSTRATALPSAPVSRKASLRTGCVFSCSSIHQQGRRDCRYWRIVRWSILHGPDGTGNHRGNQY
jgi:hypothetical protein